MYIAQNNESTQLIENKFENLFCQYFNFSDEDCSSRFDEIKNKSTKSFANYNRKSRRLVIIEDNDGYIDGLRDILPFLLFQLLDKINNFVPTVIPELSRTTLDPILIELINQQQQQQVAQPSAVLFLPSPPQVPIIRTCVNPISGILNNQPLSFFLNQGFSIIYNFTYGHDTTTDEINDIRNGCGVSDSLCMGGVDAANTDVLLVVACGCCLDVLNVTERNQPQLHNGAFWYNTPSFSIGFSPNSIIDQSTADIYDPGNNQRVSWHLDAGIGGFRVGSIVSIDDAYNKIYLKMST